MAFILYVLTLVFAPNKWSYYTYKSKYSFRVLSDKSKWRTSVYIDKMEKEDHIILLE